MRTLKRGALICALSFALSPVFAGDEDSDEYQEPTKEELLDRYDKNGDGKLSSSEKRAAVKGEILRRFDKDGDGKLSSSEKKHMKAVQRKEARFEKEVDGYLKKYDVIKKDGIIDGNELDRLAKVNKGRRGRFGGWGSDNWIEDADEDEDGEVTRKELRKALKARKKKADDWRKKGRDWRKKREQEKKGGDKKDADKKDGDKKGGDKDTGNSP